MHTSGIVAAAIAGLWIAYLLPHHLRHRQRALESRTEDRFSGELRILAVAEAPRRGGGAVPERTAGAHTGIILVPGRAREGAVVMDRPTGTQDKLTAAAAREAAARRANRAALLARRRAAAQRRALLSAALVTVSVAAWGAVAIWSAQVLIAVVPTVLLAGVLVLGRRAAVAAARSDAEWEAAQRRGVGHAAVGRSREVPEARSKAPSVQRQASAVQRRSVRDAAADDEAGAEGPVARSGDRSAARSGETAVARIAVDDLALISAPAVTGEVQDGTALVTSQKAEAAEPEESWEPVRVPLPTYTLKPPAPRREPVPMEDLSAWTQEAPAPAQATRPAQPRPAAGSAGGGEAAAGDQAAGGGQPAAGGQPAVGLSAMTLDDILARRSAAGA